jgi:hypothetical protein
MNLSKVPPAPDLRAIYRRAIDSRARDDELTAWRQAVETEIDSVIAAPTVEAAAALIAWWHYDWTQFGDTPEAAAARIWAAAADARGGL